MSVPYEQWKEEWLLEIKEARNTVAIAERFTWKIMKDYLGFDPYESGDDAIYCDGANDGGIDFVCKVENQEAKPEGENGLGTVWYIVQSKYESAYSGYQTLESELKKIINSIERPESVSDRVQKILSKFSNFIKYSSENDNIEILFVISKDGFADKMDNDASHLFEKYVKPAFKRFSFNGQVILKVVSLQSIHQSQVEVKKTVEDLRGEFVQLKDNNTLVGAVSLYDLYRFMKRIQRQTKNADSIYEKNIRLFLGPRGKINKSIKQTIEFEPKNFILFNNGVTIVAEKVEKFPTYSRLIQPNIVNGCQTSRTIFDTLDSSFGHGASGQENPEDMNKYKNAFVSVKITITQDETLLERITKHTNSQNTVQAKDFVALDKQFQLWKNQMEQEYRVFLEIQRGSWDARKAAQRRNSNILKLDEYAYAFDLMKIYGAGWLGYPGVAFKANAPFLPGGQIFQEIVDGDSIDVIDLYAAYRLGLAATASPYNFGRNAQKISRKQTKSLFFFLVIDFIRHLTDRRDEKDNLIISKIIVHLFEKTPVLLTKTLNYATSLLDRYIPENEKPGDNIYQEKDFEGNPNNYLKKPGLMRENNCAEKLNALVKLYHLLIEEDKDLSEQMSHIAAEITKVKIQLPPELPPKDGNGPTTGGGRVERGGGRRPNTITSTNPATLKISYQNQCVFQVTVRFSKDMLISVCNWLIKQNKLLVQHCPVEIPSARNRCIVNAKPYHPDGHEFISPRELDKGLHIEINTAHDRIERQITHLLARFYPGSDWDWC